MKIEKNNVWYDNGRWHTFINVFVPLGRGLFLTPRLVFLIEGYSNVKGVYNNVIKFRQNISHDDYTKNFSNLKNHYNNEEAFGIESGASNLQKAIAYCRHVHFKEYFAEESDKNTKGVIYVWRITLSADELSKIDEQIEIILNRWSGRDGAITDKNNPLQFFELDYKTGKMLRSYNNLFEKLTIHDADIYTSTNRNYAGLDFYSTSYLQDSHGVPIGYDTLGNSIVGGEGTGKSHVLFDFVSSTKKQAVIAIPSDSNMFYYRNTKTGKEQSLSSVTGQAVANQFSMEGHKVKHIVLNDFDYSQLSNSHMYQATKDDFEIIDVSQVSVNLLEPFGIEDRDDQVSLFEYMQEKMELVFNVLHNFELSEGQKSDIRTAYVKALYSAGKWSSSASSNKNEQRLLNQPTFPLLNQFLGTLQTTRDGAKEDKMESQYDKANVLVQIVERNIRKNKRLLASPTTLRDNKTRQTVYSFKNIKDTISKNIQFINLINFISATVEEGDVIVLHGANKLDKRIFKGYVKNVIQTMQERGGYIIYCFDNSTDSNENGTTIFELDGGAIYTEFDKEFDWAILGRTINPSPIEQAFRQPLSQTVKTELAAQHAGRVLLRRPMTGTLTIVDLMLLV